MEEIPEIAARLAGALYAVGGLIAIRAMAVSEMLDRALNMITLKREPARVVARRWLLGAGAVLTGASGVAAALLSSWAVPLFVVNLALQAGWLMWARTAFPPEDAEEAADRRRTTNAALGCAALTLLVVYLWRDGRLAAPLDPWTALPTAAALLGYGAYLVHGLRWRSKSGWDGGGDDDAAEALSDPPARHPSRIRFTVHPWRYPILDAGDDYPHNHFDLLDIVVADEIEEWHGAYVALFAAAGEGARTVFASEEEEEAHRAKGAEFVEYLRGIYGRDNVEGPFYVPLADVRAESAY